MRNDAGAGGEAGASASEGGPAERDVVKAIDANADADATVVSASAVSASVFAPVWPVPTTVKSLVTTRCGGVSVAPYDDGAGSGKQGLNLGFHTGDAPDAVAHNRGRLAEYVGHRPIAWVDQCHGVAVAVAGDVIRDAAQGQQTVADAVISDKTDEVCAIMVADCLPVLFADTQSRVVGAAHAGWRGLCAGVLERTAQAMRATIAAEEEVTLLAYLGPSIGPTAFEVGAEVRDAFVQAALPDEVAATTAAFVALPAPQSAETPSGLPQKYMGDLPALAKLRLARAGITLVYGGDACTFSDKRRFYSYRRDGRTGRLAAVIWRQGKP